LVPKLAREYGVEKQARTFTAFSHVVALLYAQLSHALSLNDVCDGLGLMATPLRAVRGARAPSRNALSHANKIRDCRMAEALFWQVLKHLQQSFPGFRREFFWGQVKKGKLAQEILLNCWDGLSQRALFRSA
jgi:hypothetical protein